jgi:hypothetical protein
MPRPTTFDQQLNELNNWHACVVAALTADHFGARRDREVIRDQLLQYVNAAMKILGREQQRQ